MDAITVTYPIITSFPRVFTSSSIRVNLYQLDIIGTMKNPKSQD